MQSCNDWPQRQPAPGPQGRRQRGPRWPVDRNFDQTTTAVISQLGAWGRDGVSPHQHHAVVLAARAAAGGGPAERELDLGAAGAGEAGGEGGDWEGGDGEAVDGQEEVPHLDRTERGREDVGEGSSGSRMGVSNGWPRRGRPGKPATPGSRPAPARRRQGRHRK